MTKVKVCGVTNIEDAKCAIEGGADYVGLIFAPSKRRVVKAVAKKIVDACAGFDGFIGVFMNGKKRVIKDVCEFAGIKRIQLHGDETPAFCNYLIKAGLDVIKVFRVKDSDSLIGIEKYDKVQSFLFDTYVQGQEGGTGVAFDWRILQGNDFLKDKKVFIGGGLDHRNVGEVITQVHPFCVDASSCLEAKVGQKDHEKVRLFINTAKGEIYADN